MIAIIKVIKILIIKTTRMIKIIQIINNVNKIKINSQTSSFCQHRRANYKLRTIELSSRQASQIQIINVNHFARDSINLIVKTTSIDLTKRKLFIKLT